MTRDEMEKFCQAFNGVYLDQFMEQLVRCYVAIKPELMMFFEIGVKRLVLDSELNPIPKGDPRLVLEQLPQPPRFMDLYLKGKVSSDDIHDFIKEWHKKIPRKAIHDYLGMTMHEYYYWALDERNLASIVFKRRQQMATDKT